MDKPTNNDTASALWDEAERTGNTPVLCAATSVLALIEAATNTRPMPADVAQSTLALLIPPLCDGLGIDHAKFLEFTFRLAETRLALQHDGTRH